MHIRSKTTVSLGALCSASLRYLHGSALAFAALTLFAAPAFCAIGGNAGREIVFIDSAVADTTAIAAAVQPGVEMVMLDPAQDELAQINNVLHSRHDLNAIHLISHGAPGAIRLGNQRLDSAAMASIDFSAWKTALARKAEVLLYGCDVAKGDVGNKFVVDLAQATGAVVAASTDATGAARLGGNWRLEFQTSAIDTSVKRIDSPDFSGLLAEQTINLGGPVSSGSLASGDFVIGGLIAFKVTSASGFTVTQSGSWLCFEETSADGDFNVEITDPAAESQFHFVSVGVNNLSTGGAPGYGAQLSLAVYSDSTSVTSSIIDGLDTINLAGYVPACNKVILSDIEILGYSEKTKIWLKDLVVDLSASIPRVSSITRSSPTSSPTSANALTWQVTFSEAVNNVDASDFTVSGTTATITSVSTVSGSVYNVTASGGDLAANNSTVYLNFASGQNIAGLTGISLGNTTPTGTNNNYYTLDNTSPSVVIGSPSTSSTASGPVTYVVSYSDAYLSASALTAGNITLNKTGTANGTVSVSETDITSWSVTISGITGNGTLGISIASGTASDEAGNIAPAAGPSATFTVINPLATTTTLASGANPSTYGQFVTFTATVTSGATGTVTFKDGSTTLGTGTLSSGSATFTTSVLTAGSHSITAIYGGDASYATSTSSVLTQTVDQASSSTSVSSGLNPSTYGQSVTFTATVTSGATGTVTFKDGSTTLGTGTVSSGSATFSTSVLTAGSHSITAIYGGDANHVTSASSVLTQTVNQASSSTSVSSSVNPSTYGQSVTFTAMVTSGATGTVTFKEGSITLGTATVSSGSAAISVSTLTTGSYAITAVYGGDTNFITSTSSVLTQTVNQASSTTLVSSGLNPSAYGQPVTFTATVTSGATGTVTFKDGSNTLGTGSVNSGSATFSTSSLTAGDHSITAVYGGDANFVTSTSSVLTQTVNQASSVTSVSSSVNPSTFGQSVTFTATVTSGATGTVTFKNGATTLGTGTLSGGSATFITSALPGGSQAITAVYDGDTNYLTSTSSALAQTVNKATSTTSVASTSNPSTHGEFITFTATVTSDATGTVTFKDGTTTLGTGTLSSGSATFSTSTLTGGSHTITAVYGGDTNYVASTSSPMTQTVSQASSTTTIVSSSSPWIYGQSVTFTVTVTSGATGTVTFKDGATTLGTGTLSSGSATFSTSTLTGGNHAITAVYGGDTNYGVSTSSALVLTVSKATSTTSVASNSNPSIYGQSVIFTATVTSGAAGTVTFKDGATTLGTGTLSGGSATFATSTLTAGSHAITAVYDGDANYASSTSSVLTQTIGKATSTISVASTSNPSTHGQSVTYTATVTSGATGTVAFKDGLTTLGNGTISSGSANFSISTLAVGSHAITAVYGGDTNYSASTSSILTQQITITVPGAPLMGMARAGNGQATVDFTAPSDDGGSGITGYRVTSNPGGMTAQGGSSPLTVPGLTNGVAYTFTVTATNGIGTSAASATSDHVIPSPGGQVLIVHDGSEPDVVTHLTNQCTNGSHLTVTAQNGLPALLAGYDQIWDVRSGDAAALSSAEQTAYLSFLQGGGLLFLVGENLSMGARDTSLTQMINGAGGGSITLATPGNSQSILAPFAGPVTVADITYANASGTTVLGTGASITDDGTTSSAVVWAPGTLSHALAGGLITVFDVDFMLGTADANSKAFLANLVNYQTRVSQWTPVVASVTGLAAGNHKAGSVLTFTVNYNDAVTVTGTPALPLTIGTAAVAASYASGSGTSALVFTYTVKAGDNGTLAIGPALDLTGGGSLKDVDGFPARVALSNIGSTVGVVIDAVAPSAPVITGITGTLVSGTAEAGSTVDIYLGGTRLDSVTADGSGNWSYTLPTNDSGTLTVTATDAAGNNSSVSTGVIINTYVPVANAVNVAVAYGSSNHAIPLNITEAAATSVAVASAASHGTATASGTSITYTPATGYTGLDSFTYTASNANGTSAPALVTITVSGNTSMGPVVTLSSLSEGAVTSDLLLNVSGTISASNGLKRVTVDGVQITVLPDGRFSYPVHLKEGLNTITLIATDQADLSTTVTRTVTLDVSAPVVALAQLSDGVVLQDPHVSDSGTITLTGTESLASVTYALNGGSPLAAMVLGNTFSFGLDLVPGLNTIEVIATTDSGTSVHTKRTVTIATDLFLSVTDPETDVLVVASSYVLKGTVSSTAMPVSVTVKVGNQSLAPTVVNGGFEQVISLDTNQVWPVLVTATDTKQSTSVIRNIVKVSAVAPAVLTMADAVRALEIANGLISASADDLTKYDLAPRVNGVSTGDGRIDLEDAALVLWLASGLTL